MQMENEVKIGDFYHFWDDGKTSPSRHYICKCESIISLEEAENLFFYSKYWADDDEDEVKLSLVEIWEKNKEQSDWLYNEETPYFIVCSCPQFDENLLYFCQTKDGDWFSMDVETWWQSGLLDIDGQTYKNVIDNMMEYYKDKPEYLQIINAYESTVY